MIFIYYLNYILCIFDIFILLCYNIRMLNKPQTANRKPQTYLISYPYIDIYFKYIRKIINPKNIFWGYYDIL